MAGETKRPVALIILDGFGLRGEIQGNAVAQAHKPNFDRYWATAPHTTLTACGEAVGLPEGQMGNSEVGHLNIGAGRIVYQDLTRISKSIREEAFFTNEVLLQAVRQAKENGKKLHLTGLLSDGGVHSHVDHLLALLKLAAREGMHDVYVHAFLDGRDVKPDSGLAYVEQLVTSMKELGVGQLASLQGRYFAMDRDKRWERVEKAYRLLVNGSGKPMTDAALAVKESYEQGVLDEFVEPIVMVNAEGEPVGRIESGDSVICINFRPDRAIQLSESLTNDAFAAFDRGTLHPDKLHYVCMTTYSDSVHGAVAFGPKDLVNTLGDVVAAHGLKQLRTAETEKYPHVTFFFSGGRHEELPGETRVLIHSPKVATYDLQPEMSAFELAQSTVDEIVKDEHDMIILNFANPDMVGHSGLLAPTIAAVEATDKCLGQVVDAVLAKNGIVLVTADHGNADIVRDEQDQPHTAHTTEPVPFIVLGKHVTLRDDGILADIAPTMLELLGLPQPSDMTGVSLIKQ